MESNNETGAFPLFKGCTRVPLMFGVPVAPLFMAAGVIALISMWVSLWCYLLLIPVYLIMRAITATDDKAFRIIGLYFDTKFRNRNKRVWGASSYSPIRYSKRRFEE